MATETKTRAGEVRRGLRKYIPEAERYKERYGAFRITPRDLEILELVFRYRHVTSDHIRALFGGSGRQLTKRLQGLFHNGYLGRYVPRQRMRLDLDPGSPVIGYGLETKGWGILAEHLGRQAEAQGEEFTESWKKAYTRRMEWFLEHSLMVSHFHCVLELAVRRRRNLGLGEWRQDQELRDWVEVAHRDGRTERFGVQPDAYCGFVAGGVWRNLFLEADRASEEQRRIREKVQKYGYYLVSRRYQDRYQNPKAVRVLFVTTTEKRLELMIQNITGMEYKGKGLGQVWLTCEGRYSLEEPTSILGPIWQTAKQPDEFRSLV